MAQKTNLNVSPYYDDFDSEKNFYKVLYKPGFPVQARELTTSQSILQNQLQSFGDNIFKDGSVVIPGAISYDGNFQAVKLNSVNYGTDISVYLNNFIGKKITGQTSGITATIKYVVLPDSVNVDDITIYVTYLSSDNNSQISAFTDGELLSCTENVVYGNTTIGAGTPFASLIETNATSIGSASFITKGIYFIRGYFVNVTDQTLILDYYTNKPSYRVGLKVDEILVNAKDDNSLYDNAKGFTNYAAPGADRLQINLTLTKKLISDQNDTDFVELMRVDKGKIKFLQSKSQYNIVRDWIAERTFDESGDYTTRPFQFTLHNSLNDNLGNGGLYFKNDKTEQLNTPSKDLMCLKLSSGKAYVRGYDVEKVGTTILDVDKPRDVGIKSDVAVNFDMGSVLKVNKVSGLPKQGKIVELYSEFGTPAAANIGSARAYSFNLEDAAYTGDSTNWELRLFDIQTNTKITLNQGISATSLPKGSFVKGSNSGASGYSVGVGNGSATIVLNQTSGSFAKGEPIEINGIEYPGVVGVATAANTQNIKSVKQPASTGYPEFTANSHLEKFRLPNNVVTVNITAASAGVSTVTSGSAPFDGLRTGSIVRYVKPGETTETFNKVKEINSGGLSLVIDAISGITNGAIPTSSLQVSMFVGAPIIRGRGYLHAPLANKNVSEVNLDGSNLKVTKQITGRTISSNSTTITINDVKSQYSEVDTASFESFDQERYSVHFSNGGIGTVTSDRFAYQNNGDQVTISGLTNGTNAVVNTSIIKKGIVSKIKDYNRSKIVNVSYSKYETSGSAATGNGAASISDGLIFDRRYGLRVQDEEISLNLPDVSKFLAVYESIDTNTPTLDILQFTSTVDVQTNAIIGENISGDDSKVVARIVSKPAANKLAVVYLTGDKFNKSESVSFSESNIQTNIENITIGTYKNITNSFTLSKGQKDQYYDYSKLIRNKGTSEPSGKLLIVIDHYTVKNNDDGDVFTALSYDNDRFDTDIPNVGVNGLRATDTIDFRPRVPEYLPASMTGSPFEFSSRDFTDSIKQYIIPNESSIIGYNYYLPRVDKVYLNKFGDFIYEKGVSSENPKSPVRNDELMELGTIKLPPYLYNPQNAFLTLVDNRRYTMRDIGGIDDRVSNLEEVTSLSLLETSAQTLQIQDSEGRSRFKSGFFVDSFRDYSKINSFLSAVTVNPDLQEITPIRSRGTLALQPMPKASLISSQYDANSDFELFDSNVQKTGHAITLKYNEVEFLSQPYATEIINVNPYELPAIGGDVELDPSADTWTRTIQLEDNIIRQSGTNQVSNLNLNTNLSGSLDLGNVLSTSSNVNQETGSGAAERVNTSEETNVETFSGALSISGSASASTTINTTDTFFQNRLISSATDDFMRSRNIQYKATGFPEWTKVFCWLDGQQIFDIIPKLLEITPSSNGSNYGSVGSFTIGEEVHALDADGNIIMKFRICRPDHKDGAFNAPTSIYGSDPYSRGVDSISTDYSQTSKFLNVDTRSLAEEAQGLYFGYVAKNSRLVGQESGASAYVKDLSLITDSFGDINGALFLRDPYLQPSPTVKVNSGTKSFRLTTSAENRQAPPGQDPSIVTADTSYTAVGTVEEWQNDVTITTNTNTLNVNSTTDVDLGVTGSTTNTVRTRTVEYFDPLAQTFVVGGNILAPSAINGNDDLNGVFLTSVGVFFASIDDVAGTPVRCEIRTVTGDARPSMRIVGRTRTLYPTKVDENGNLVNNIEFDRDSASKETKFTFPEPLYLPPGSSYAAVLVAERSVNYTVWTGRHGDVAVNPQSIPGASGGSSLRYSRQYGSGSIFKSQNGALWTEDQSQDMTFKLYKAEFTSLNGTAFFTNPDLDESNGYTPRLNTNPIETLPKTGYIGITTIQSDQTALINTLSPGRKLTGNKAGTTSVITGVGCSALTSSVTDGGNNYQTQVNAETYNITGQGKDLKLSITANADGVLTGAAPSADELGTGYRVGDVVGIKTSSLTSKTGSGAKVTINSIGGIDTIYLTNIQGQATSYPVGMGISYYNNAGNVINNNTYPILSNSTFNNGGVNNGNYIKVSHFNHGMYTGTNKVKLSSIKSDIAPTTTTAVVNRDETATVSVASTSQFLTYEGIAVSAANTGYVKVNNEIIGYQSVGTGILNVANTSGNKRGVDNSIPIEHPVNSVVEKYEIGGVSLRRLETVDKLDISNLSLDLDSYYVSFDRTKNGKNRSIDDDNQPELSFKDNSIVGGSNVRGTQNIIYGALVPRFDVGTPTGISGSATNVSSTIRSVTATSVSGTENSFNDLGYEQVQLNSYNDLNSVRMVASKINENEYLSNLPRKKSFTTALTLTSNDKNISPIIYLDGVSTEFISHRLNNPVGIERYDVDNRVNSINDDPHCAQYVSNTVTLSKPATSLKVLITAYRHSSSDIRVLYNLIKSDSSEINQSFELFPGYKNLIDNDDDGFGDVVKDETKNDGRSDSFVGPSIKNQFKEYQYTADNLPEFTGYTIKIVMSGTNQAEPPRVKELRTIAVR